MGHINAFCGRNIEVCNTKPCDACLVSSVLLTRQTIKDSLQIEPQAAIHEQRIRRRLLCWRSYKSHHQI